MASFASLHPFLPQCGRHQITAAWKGDLDGAVDGSWRDFHSDVGGLASVLHLVSGVEHGAGLQPAGGEVPWNHLAAHNCRD